MSTGDPGLTAEERQILWFDHWHGERPDQVRLNEMGNVLRRAAEHADSKSAAADELSYALLVLGDMSAPPSEENYDDLFWSVSHLIDMPY